MHGTVTIKLSDVLSQFDHTRGRSLTNMTGGDDYDYGESITRSLVGWYALEVTSSEESGKSGANSTRSRKNSTSHRLVNTQQTAPRASDGPQLRVGIVISETE